MPRPLTKIEQGYIRDCLSRGEDDPKVIAKELAGVGPVTVQAFVDGYKEANKSAEVVSPRQEQTVEPESDLTPEEIEEERKKREDETEAEHKIRLATDNRLTAGKLMGRKNGIVVMTEGASEMVDARKILQPSPTSPEQIEKQKSRIHRPFHGENQGGARDTSTRKRM